MQVKEIIEFMDRTLNEGRYTQTLSGERSFKERAFAQWLKISEEVWELNEQLLGKFQGQRTSKKDKISDEHLQEEIADVILASIRLARLLDLDVEELLSKKMEKLQERFTQPNS